MRITLATAMGTCFGVQDAIDMALDPQYRNKLTVVGQLVHNPQTVERLEANGIRIIEREQIDEINTPMVMITAHGAAASTKTELEQRGFHVLDASCPLVIRLHKLALFLERKGYFPVIIGQRNHVEVKGVVGDLQNCAVVGDESDLHVLDGHTKIGVVSQTTNRLERVDEIVQAIRDLPHVEDLRFIDTICQPVKDRQQAIIDLVHSQIDVGIVVGGKNSSNTRKLYDVIRDHGIDAYHISTPDEMQRAWFSGKTHIGVTAGTSTPQDVIESVYERIKVLSHA